MENSKRNLAFYEYLGAVQTALDTISEAAKEDIEDKAGIVSALKATKLDTIVGPISWENGPTPNVAKTPLVGGQWGKGQDFPWELTITSNATATNIPTSGSIRQMPGS